jgi:hypothetical protein
MTFTVELNQSPLTQSLLLAGGTDGPDVPLLSVTFHADTTNLPGGKCFVENIESLRHRNVSKYV